MRSAGSVLVAVVFLFVMGCQRESRVAVSPEPQPPQVSSDQQELLEEILQYTRDTGSTVEQLAEEARRREALEQAPRGVAAIGDDLRVAKALVAAARSAATSKQSEKTAAALGRLAPTLTVLRSEIPAAAIAQHLEQDITCLVAETVVDAFEAIEIDQYQAEARVVSFAARYCRGHATAECGPIRQPCQLVQMDQLAEATIGPFPLRRMAYRARERVGIEAALCQEVLGTHSYCFQRTFLVVVGQDDDRCFRRDRHHLPDNAETVTVG